MSTSTSLDGRIAQAWGGTNPHGVHLNVVLGVRGSATAAAMTATFSAPATGFTPILVCVGPDQPSYETINPPTIMLNKVVVDSDTMSSLVAGACQVGIAQGVLDSVAEDLLVADQETIVFVSVWVNPQASHSGSVRAAARQATGAAIREAIAGPPAQGLRRLVRDRETLTHPFYRAAHEAPEDL